HRDAHTARALARHAIAFYATLAYYDIVLTPMGFTEAALAIRAAMSRHDIPGMINAVTDAMVEALAVAGTPDEVRRQLAQFDGLVDTVILYGPYFAVDSEAVKANHQAMIETLGQGEVIGPLIERASRDAFPQQGITAMEQLQRTTVEYYLRTGPQKELRSFGFDYIPVPRLPRGNSSEVVFRRAIAACEDATLRPILNDLYRWLVFSNYAGFTSPTPHSTREEVLQEMDRVYPYDGALREAEHFRVSYHPFGDTQGAVLYLLMNSKNPQDINHRLGGILTVVLEHPHFKKYGVPTIDDLQNTVIP